MIHVNFELMTDDIRCLTSWAKRAACGSPGTRTIRLGGLAGSGRDISTSFPRRQASMPSFSVSFSRVCSISTSVSLWRLKPRSRSLLFHVSFVSLTVSLNACVSVYNGLSLLCFRLIYPAIVFCLYPSDDISLSSIIFSSLHILILVTLPTMGSIHHLHTFL